MYLFIFFKILKKKKEKVSRLLHVCIFFKKTYKNIQQNFPAFHIRFFKDGFTLGPDYNVRKSFIIVHFNGFLCNVFFFCWFSCRWFEIFKIVMLLRFLIHYLWIIPLPHSREAFDFFFSVFFLLKAGIEIIQKKKKKMQQKRFLLLC